MQQTMQAMQEQQAKQQQQEEMKKALLKTLLTPQARERLANVKIANPRKAAGIEAYLVKNARNFRGGVSDETLKGLLGSMGTSTTKVVIKRRPSDSDSDSDDNDDDLL